jgi:hypothetical protein
LGKKKEEKLRGDKLRELILLVYFNNKYDKDKNKIPWLREKLGYSTGGLYNALDDSGYFDRKQDEINLTEKGIDYLNNHILPQYTIVYPICNAVIILGFVLLLQWYFWTYTKAAMIFPWYSALMIIAMGLTIRFLFMRMSTSSSSGSAVKTIKPKLLIASAMFSTLVCPTVLQYISLSAGYLLQSPLILKQTPKSLD